MKNRIKTKYNHVDDSPDFSIDKSEVYASNIKDKVKSRPLFFIVFPLVFASIGIYLLHNLLAAAPHPINPFSCPKVNGQYISLKVGSKDGDTGVPGEQCVSGIQWGFKTIGNQSQVTINGVFDTPTQTAVKNFQRFFRYRTIDGVMTPKQMSDYAYFFGIFKTTTNAASGVAVTNEKGVDNLTFGATHTQYSLDSWGDPAAVARGKTFVNQAAPLQVQSIMGWGALNPEPSPGVYDFASLDARINGVMSGAATKVITLCGAPDWMKGGAAGGTDWSKLETAPTPSHYDDFADLAATVAKRYPSVKYFQVWNELKGFYNQSQNRWDYEGYTALYNKVYAKVKAARPDAKIGGPYVVMDSWSGPQSNPSTVSGQWGKLDQRPLDVVQYWLQNKIGADFITLDAGTGNRDSNVVDDFVAAGKFTAITNWLRGLNPTTYPGGNSLPLWWAEWYPYSGTVGASSDLKTAVMINNLFANINAGAQTIALWQPQGDGQGDVIPYGTLSYRGLITDTRAPNGGAATSLYTATKILHDNFPAGTKLYDTTNQNAGISILASASHLFMVNKTATTQNITVYGTNYTLAPYGFQLASVPGQ